MFTSILLIAIFVVILWFIKGLKKKKKSFNFRVLTALVIGLVFGLIVQLTVGTEQSYLENSKGEKIESYVMATDVANDPSIITDEEGNTIPVLINFADLGLDDNAVTSTFDTDALKYDGVIVETQGDLTDPTYYKEKNTASANLMMVMSIVSSIYISLLKLIVIPLIFISITTAIINARGKANLGKKVTKIITFLLVTVGISAIIGVMTSLLLGIDGAALQAGLGASSDVVERTATLTERSTSLTSMSIADLITAPIPSDFSFLVGQGDTAALTTVLFGMFLGYSILQVDKRYPERVELFINILNSTKEVVLSMVREILKLTPFAIVALMATFMSTTDFAGMSQLLLFVIGTYVAIAIMYVIHLLILAIFGLNPVKFAVKSFPVLLFGFGSRSSMAALTLNTQTQREELGVDEMTSDLAGTFGVTIGQNGCAGIYPAMIAVMAMQANDLSITFGWLIMLTIVIAISSFGIAGVGGGATFAAIAVLSIMGLPVTMAAVLISVEPLLDMARTALNISDSMLAGVVISKIDGELDMETYNE
ncbi:cation:dicarboxylase symporter family transporter [Mollicutes bacterium LVI A0078]|nr:cation:dicarboxylase symporter family transporter [Mollicutes bacterium LVI A0075]WOO90420.1 cation:dicarboxylase symporter family transporter [Mollicutes bacterium LVI A0078]